MVLGLFLPEKQRGRGGMISQQTYTEELGENFDTNWGGSIPLPTTCKLYEFGNNQERVYPVVK